MDIKLTLVATTALIGAYLLGIPFLYCLLAFNVVIWGDILYRLVTSTEDEILNKLLTETTARQPTQTQVKFDKLFLQKYLESTLPNNSIPNEEIQLLENNITTISEN